MIFDELNSNSHSDNNSSFLLEMVNDDHSLIFKTVIELSNFWGHLLNFFSYICPLTRILNIFNTNTHSDELYVIASLLFMFLTDNRVHSTGLLHVHSLQVYLLIVTVIYSYYGSI